MIHKTVLTTIGTVFVKSCAILLVQWFHYINKAVLQTLYLYTVKCRYNAPQFVTILRTALRLHWQKGNQTLESQETPNNVPSRVNYGCLLWGFLRKLAVL